MEKYENMGIQKISKRPVIRPQPSLLDWACNSLSFEVASIRTFTVYKNPYGI